VNALNEKTSNDQDTEKSKPDREYIRRRSVVYGAIAAVAMAIGFIVVFSDLGTTASESIQIQYFGMLLIAISIALFMRAARLRNEYYLGISSKGWSGMPTDKDIAEALKRVGVGKGMNAGSSAKEAERDAELTELRHELKELRSQLKENSQAGRDDKPAS